MNSWRTNESSAQEALGRGIDRNGRGSGTSVDQSAASRSKPGEQALQYSGRTPVTVGVSLRILSDEGLHDTYEVHYRSGAETSRKIRPLQLVEEIYGSHAARS